MFWAENHFQKTLLQTIGHCTVYHHMAWVNHPMKDQIDHVVQSKAPMRCDSILVEEKNVSTRNNSCNSYSLEDFLSC